MSQPFFIACVGRSGSTLLYRILARHPKVALTNEARVADFLVFASSYAAVARGEERTFETSKQQSLHGIVAPWERDHFDAFFRERGAALLEEWYRARFPDRDFTHWGDKMPLALTPLALQSAFPHAKFLVLARDPRDFVCSLFAYMQRPDSRALDPYLELDAARQGRDWAAVYGGYLEHLQDKLVVTYERLVQETDTVVEEVLAYLRLEPCDEIRAGDDAGYFAEHATAKSPAATIGRWRDELAPDDLRAIESACGDVMRALGYALSTDESAAGS